MDASDLAHFPDRDTIDRPPPDLAFADGSAAYIVKAVWPMKTEKSGGSRVVKYLIKWQGCPDPNNTWEPAVSIQLQTASAEVWEMVHAFDRR
jgi:hypothetical protein